jgi:hypothetical protein
MKKLFVVLMTLIFTTLSSRAMTFKEAFDQTGNKPMLLLVYAQWADGYSSALQQFRTFPQVFGNKFNYVEMDIASKQTKEFNKIYHIYPNLPYVLMIRNNGKIIRYFQEDCFMNNSCIQSKVNAFVR